jgi:hypothetical protein
VGFTTDIRVTTRTSGREGVFRVCAVVSEVAPVELAAVPEHVPRVYEARARNV